MKRSIHAAFLGLGMLMAFYTASAQSYAMEGKVTHNKANKVAAVIEFPYSPEEVTAAIKTMMAERGVKPDKSKDFLLFRNATLTSHMNELHDLHFKVDRKSRKDKNSSLVYLIVGRPSENIALRTESDRHKLEEGKEFLNTVLPHVEKHHLQVQVNTQSGAITKMQKSLQNLEKEQVDLEKRIKQYQDKLIVNKQAQEKARLDLAREREVLEAMKVRQSN